MLTVEVRYWGSFLRFILSVIACFFVVGAEAQIDGHSSSVTGENDPRIQVLDGSVSAADGMEFYHLRGMKQGETIYVEARTTTGNLDPVVLLLKQGIDPGELTRKPLDELIRSLSSKHDPIEVTRQLFDRYTLAGNDDAEGHYYARIAQTIPDDGDYWLAVGSSLVRPSSGAYRLVVGIDAPDAWSGRVEETGLPFVFPHKNIGALDSGVVSVTGELMIDQPVRYYYLTGLARDQVLYAYAEAITDDLVPVLTLLDGTDKPVAYANFTGTESETTLQYRLPAQAEGYRLKISSRDGTGQLTTGNYRLLLGLNAPEVLTGESESTGRDILREPIPVSIGIKLQQITDVDQKAENFGVVASLVMHWTDPALAYDPETVHDRYKIYESDLFSAEMARRGLPWPQFTIVNQQGNRWVQNRLVVVFPHGEAAYLERFSTTLQAPDFDFRNFPFDIQKFFIRIDLLAAEWLFSLQEIENYSAVGEELGEEEWVVTEFETRLERGSILQRPVSRFSFEFMAKRHVAYYVFRILLPLVVIISVSWILFFLKDYAKRVDAAGANLLLFIAFNFAISNDLPRLGYLTFLDTLLISAFLVTAVVLILSVYLRRQDMRGRKEFVAKVDRYVIIFYPLAYILTIVTVTSLFR